MWILVRICVNLRFQEIFSWLSGTQGAGDLFEERGVVSFTTAVQLKGTQRNKMSLTQQNTIDFYNKTTVKWFCMMTYRSVENIQHLDGRVFAGRPWHINSFDVRRVVEVDQFFGDLRQQTEQVHWSRGANQCKHQIFSVCAAYLLCPCSWNPTWLQPLHKRRGSPKRRRTKDRK